MCPRQEPAADLKQAHDESAQSPSPLYRPTVRARLPQPKMAPSPGFSAPRTALQRPPIRRSGWSYRSLPPPPERSSDLTMSHGGWPGVVHRTRMERLAERPQRPQAGTEIRARAHLLSEAAWLPLPQWLSSSSAGPLRDRQAERVFPTPQDLRSPNRPS